MDTITFLFTDIEGSTRLWERLPDAMRLALARHDALLRAAVEHCGGRVFKLSGDGFYVAFQDPAAALAAAILAQRDLQRESWGEVGSLRVRMALHTGAVEARDNDYFGRPLNRVARLLAAGHGGQILISLAVQELVRDQLPEGASLLDLGERRLKDLTRPERVFQVVAPGLALDFPPLRSLEAFAHNLPLQVTSFVGREREMAEVKRLVPTTRLLTLTGVGGTGKTRLSLQVGADMMEHFSDGVWLVELAPLADPALVGQAVAAVLGIRIEADAPIQATLVKALQTKELLLILDNCEHLVGAAAALAEHLMRGCPRLHLLASSREALGIPGEVSWPVPSLSLPARPQGRAATLDPAQLTQFEAVRLFVDRALAVHPTFQVTNENAPALAEICHRLDGIPLAIELAAARVKGLSVEAIATRLDDRFRLLTGGSRTALPRQQTLRALIDWSYDLLTEAERQLLRRLSVFAGGWTLEAAETICAGDGLESYEVLDLLLLLVNKSLVLVEEGSREVRYRLLETIRQYARERLLAAGPAAPSGISEGEALRERHLAFFTEWAERRVPEIHGPQRATALAQLDADHDNVRVAMEWATEQGDLRTGLRLMVAWSPYWENRFYIREGFDRLQRLLVRSGESPLPEAEQPRELKARSLVGQWATHLGELPTARTFYHEVERLAIAQNNRGALAAAFAGLGSSYAYSDLERGQAYYQDALAIYEELQDRDGQAAVCLLLGRLVYDRGEYASAASYYERALEIHRALGVPLGIAHAMNLLGEVLITNKAFEKAMGLFQEALSIYRGHEDLHGMGVVLNTLGELARHAGNYPQAVEHYSEALALARRIEQKYLMAGFVQNLAFACARAGDDERARAAHHEALILLEELEGIIGIGMGCIGAAQLAGGTPEGAAWLGAASALFDRGGAKLYFVDASEYDYAVALTQKALGEQRFNAAWEAGRQKSMSEVYAEVLQFFARG